MTVDWEGAGRGAGAEAATQEELELDVQKSGLTMTEGR